jgi:hypothetical protein
MRTRSQPASRLLVRMCRAGELGFHSALQRARASFAPLSRNEQRSYGDWHNTNIAVFSLILFCQQSPCNSGTPFTGEMPMLAHPSPKRKRDQVPPIPLLNTALALRPAPTPPQPRGSPAPSSGADSPRNAVANQLEGMTIAAIPMSPLTPTDDVIRKKPKLDAMRVDSGTGSGTETTRKPSVNGKHGNNIDTVAVLPRLEASSVIPETPQAAQPRLLPDIASFAHTASFVSSPASPVPRPHTFTSQKSRAQNPSSSQPRSRKKSPSPSPSPPPPPPLSALTWQDSEITGHLADPSTDPDDDGTGLNGIGFKPTPALAYARSQKRRQQLNEWKLRETREARAKRSERRRRGIRGTPSASASASASRESTLERDIIPVKQVETTKRSVKFAI